MTNESKTQPLFLKPIFHHKMWGGTKLKDFNYQINEDQVGEAWLASTYGEDLSIIMNGNFKEQSLKTVWEHHPELFNHHPADEAFPLLVKILDAKRNLSIQVHPDDYNAGKYFKEPNGKTECWYILSAEPGSKAYFGHKAQTADEMKAAIKNHQLADLLNPIAVKPGDMIYVSAGTLHALGAGIVALEIEQSSDDTLRFYDFDRVDAETGKKRPLQVDEAIEVTNFPNVEPDKKMTLPITDKDNKAQTSILRAKYFKVSKINNDKPAVFTTKNNYSINIVIDGTGSLIIDNQKYQVNKGMTFVLPSPISEYQLEGNLDIIRITE
ncbi:type I phosphomannose isomerase catalytic subunit [Fructilactobacillus sp. Tb1]|uniref:type I phosphomannose isomerase catalytic subunit n=1 Tax=Fructilactobacillus sp. Tb1 TaxID=3422304 RepID=UPI003D269341